MRRTYNVVAYKNGLRSHFTVIRNTLDEVVGFMEELVWIDNYSNVDVDDSFGNLLCAC